MTTVRQRLPLGQSAFNLRAAALSVALLIAGTLTAAAESPAAYMQRVANQLVAASRTGSEADFATTIRSHADVPTIGLTALGSYAQTLPKADRPAYYNGMISFIARYAAKEAPKYPVAKAIMVGQTKETAAGIYVDSRVTLKSGETYDVRWRLVRRGGVFKVRDAEIIGFEMTSFLNTLFQNFISENGGNPKTLVIALNR
ncbi:MULTISPECIES: ABC transporter substrate-binding protein [Hyphomicrobium]|jgi:phospholipid transport system substrate-binding protein|uniref:ABC transporter substrate-binding protein n=1 Tax=Hyphomicrobium TaxID=81 RepID=UPI000379EAEE|nr:MULTISPECIES: ABC transporter substrate-binding protein [Hyphomicrobium]WBT36647.1 ABC transporter substrate-binding protein [Hyphomicrobium sp. DMF-1]HML44982.1 ABC transporter substrate-binding protein [Hyphomicrobium zavarzinii]